MKQRVCLIVDNPLRDLDGLILLAWQLASRDAEVWLVPMYEQGFDVFSIKPDWVIANYVRPNNLDLLRLYRRAGIRVGILDTEGAGGKTAEEFANMVAHSGGTDLIDLYCVWGDGQFEALRSHGALSEASLRLTGCPRYDYCVSPWREALPKPIAPHGYILVNTNFPVVNPRFSAGSKNEMDAMVLAGFSADFAASYIRDARVAYQGIVNLLAELLEAFPAEHFVLRPHPFENAQAYASLLTSPNFEVRQEGTSLEWINQASALVHLNCSTAIEASMLGCEALSPAWLDTPALHLSGPHSVSLHANSVVELVDMIRTRGAGEAPPASSCIVAARQTVFREIYHAIDGKAAERVADAILENVNNAKPFIPKPSLRGAIAHLARQFLGYHACSMLRQRIANSQLERRRLAKRFSVNDVRAVLDRLSIAAGSGTEVCVEEVTYASGNSVRVYVKK